jgi:hypothetical protein
MANESFRTHTIYVSARVAEALSVLAEVESYSCKDEAADVILGLHLSQNQHLDWLIRRTRDDRTRRMGDYKAKVMAADTRLDSNDEL